MDTVKRIERLERRLRIATAGFVLVTLSLVVTAWRVQDPLPTHLRVRQITIVDENGVDRVWIGAPLPDPIIQGQRGQRAGPISGIVLLDSKGNERSGYVTSDWSGEVFMALDSERGQETLFLVNPGGGGHLSIYDADRNLARIGVLNGQPHVLLREKGEVIWKAPEEPGNEENQ